MLALAERRELYLFSRLYSFNIKLLLTNSMPFHKTRSGKISRAQKYRIKWKAPWIFSKKLLKHIQNKVILAKIKRKPIKTREVYDEMSKYTITSTIGSNKMPCQMSKLKKDVIQRELLSFWKKIQLMKRYRILFRYTKTDAHKVNPTNSHPLGIFVNKSGVFLV